MGDPTEGRRSRKATGGVGVYGRASAPRRKPVMGGTARLLVRSLFPFGIGPSRGRQRRVHHWLTEPLARLC
jgi:hypothetical protein